MHGVAREWGWVVCGCGSVAALACSVSHHTPLHGDARCSHLPAAACCSPALEVTRELPNRTPTAVSLSPNGQFLVTWQRKLADEPNLCVFRVATGELVAEFHQRVFTQESWPSVAWTDDGLIAVRLHPDGVHVFAGDFATASPIAKLAVDRIKACWVAPGKAPAGGPRTVPKPKKLS